VSHPLNSGPGFYNFEPGQFEAMIDQARAEANAVLKDCRSVTMMAQRADGSMFRWSFALPGQTQEEVQAFFATALVANWIALRHAGLGDDAIEEIVQGALEGFEDADDEASG
jgi:hypothetical protein